LSPGGSDEKKNSENPHFRPTLTMGMATEKNARRGGKNWLNPVRENVPKPKFPGRLKKGERTKKKGTNENNFWMHTFGLPKKVPLLKAKGGNTYKKGKHEETATRRGAIWVSSSSLLDLGPMGSLGEKRGLPREEGIQWKKKNKTWGGEFGVKFPKFL